MKTRTHQEFLKALLSDKRIMAYPSIFQIIQDKYDQMFYPEHIQLAMEIIKELSSDPGFMGSPEYTHLKDEIDSFMAKREQKKKEEEDYAQYIRLKEKFEKNVFDNQKVDPLVNKISPKSYYEEE